MPRIRVTFDKVEIKATFHWTEDGKRRQKTQTFMQTVNPFNKNAEGLPKSRAEITDELLQQRAAWLVDMQRQYPST